jgi:adenylate kinase
LKTYFGLTGTPGTGKKTLAPAVARRMGLPCVSLRDLAVSSGQMGADDNDAEIDIDSLCRYLVNHVNGSALIYGHLLPYVVRARELERVVILRCEPTTLKRRLLVRGYWREKVVENVEAELIGILSADSIAAFGVKRTAEFDTTESKLGESVKAISALLKGTRKPSPRIDWTLGYGSAPKLRSLLSVRGTRPAST